MKKIISMLLTLAMVMTVLAGCGGQNNSEKDESKNADGKERVTVALWGNQMQENYTQYLCDSFPDVEFEFVLVTNSTDFYRFRHEHGDLPDILTVRRFSLRDTVLLKDYLFDLGDSELAATYFGTYLDNYMYEDGTVNWLPICAEVDSIIINQTLFEEYNVPIPTDYESFLAACEAFEQVGIRGFVSDFEADYTCMEVLQGLSGAQLMSMEGRTWRQAYESGATDQLYEEVWIPVFEKFFDLKDRAGLGESDTTMSFDDVKELFIQGKVAMYRGTGNDIVSCQGRGDDKVVLMPYFGNLENENRYLTYPAFQIAAGNQGMEDPEREKLILNIMEAMLNQEGQSHLSFGQNMVSYNRNVTLELLPELDNLKPYIEDNKMYIRLASNEMFSISQQIVQKILLGELGSPQEAFDAFNVLLQAEVTEDPVVAHIDKTYSNEFTAKHGNQAASAFCNTIREELGADLVYAQASLISGDLCDGDYTERELGYLTNTSGTLLRAEMTGEELYQMVEASMALRGNRGSVCNDSTLYVSSGFEMDITKMENEYSLNQLTIDGKELDREATYDVVLFGDYDWYMPVVTQQVGFEVTYADLPKGVDIIKKRLVEDGAQLEEPTDYITVR